MWIVIFHIFFCCVLLNYNKKRVYEMSGIEKVVLLCYITDKKWRLSTVAKTERK